MLGSIRRLSTLSLFSLVIVTITLSLTSWCRAQNFDRPRGLEEENDILAKLVKEGKTDEASKLLARDFRQLALLHLDLNSTRDLTYELNFLSKKIKDYALMEPMLEELHPGVSTTVEAIGSYAFALGLSQQREESIAQYRALLEANPKEDGVRLRLLQSESTKDFSTFGEQFQKVQPHNRLQFVSKLLHSVQGPRGLGDQVVLLAQTLVEWAETAPPAEDLSWLEPLQKACSGHLPYKIDTYTYRDRAPQYRTFRTGLVYENVDLLDVKTRSQKFTDPEKKKKLEMQQREIHNRIARKMIEVPQLASVGFSALEASQRVTGEGIPKTLADQAKNAIFIGGEHNPFGIAGDNEFQKLTPAKFLARQLGLDSERANRDKNVQEIVTRLNNEGLGNQALNLQGMYSLYKTSEESYSKYATDYLAEVKEHSPYSPELHAFALSDITAICIERDLNVDLTEIFVNEITEFAPEDTSFDVQIANIAIGKFLGHLPKKNSEMVAEASLTQLRDAYLGDIEKQQALWALLKKQDSVLEGDSRLWPLGQYSQMFDEATRSREFFFAGLVEAEKVQGSNEYNNLMYRRFAEHLNRFESDEIPVMLDWLKSGGLLDDLREYDLSQVDGQGTPFISSFLLAFSNEMSTNACFDLRGSISKKEKKTFGESLIYWLLLGNTSTDIRDGRSLRQINTFNALGEHLEELRRVSPKRQLKILTFVDGLQKQFIAIGGFERVYTLEGKEARGLLHDFRKGELRQRDAEPIQKLLAAEKIDDLGLSDEEFYRWVFQFVQKCDQTDTDNFVAVFCKTNELVKQITDRRQVFGGEGAPVIANVALNTIDLQTLKILLAIYKEDRLEDFSVIPMLNGRLHMYLAQIFESGYAVDESKSEDFQRKFQDQSQGDVQNALEHFQNKLGSHLGDQDMRQLSPLFIRMFARLPRVIREHIGKCFEDQPKANLKYPNIDHAMRISWKLGEFFWLDDDPRGNLTNLKHATPPSSVEKVLPHQEELMTLLQDESMPLHARLPFANAMLEWDMYLPPDCIFPACEVLTEAAKNRACIHSQQIDNALKIMLRHRDDPRFATVAGELAKFWAQDFSDRDATGYEQTYARRYFPLNNATRTIAITGDGRELLTPTAKHLMNLEQCQILIESGFADLAKIRFQNSCEEDYRILAFEFEQLRLQPQFFTTSLKKNLPKFLKRFDNPGRRILAEAFFATRSEEEHPAQFCLYTHEDRKQRVLDLCRRFKTTKFSSDREKEIAAALLVQTPEGVIKLASEIPSLAKRHSAETQDPIGAQLFIANVAVQAYQGDLDSVFKVQDKITSEPNPARRFEKVSNNGQINGEFRQLRRMVQIALVMKKRGPQEYRKMLPRLLRKTSPDTAYCFFRELCILAHVVAGKEGQLLSAWKDIKPVRTVCIDMEDLIVLAAKYADQRKMKPKQREKFVNRIWVTGHKLKGMVDKDKQNWRFGLDLLEYTGVLNGQQIQVLGPKLAEINSVRGELWNQLGRRYCQQEQYQQASEMFLKAIESRPKQNNDEMRILRRISYVESLLKLGQNDKAKKQLQEKHRQIDLDQRHHWSELKKRAGM